MQRAEHQVPRDCRSDSDFSRFLVTNFSDHYDVRVLTENTSQRRRERHIRFRVDLNLIYAVKCVLDRVFDGDDVHFGRVLFLKEGIKRGGFSAARRSGKQNYAVRVAEDFIDNLVFRRRETEFLTGKSERRFIENTDNELFAVNRRERRYTEIVLRAVDDKIDSSVLRNSSLRYVQAGKNFNSRADCGVRFDREIRSFLQVAVDTITDFNDFFVRLYVNIARSERNRFFDDRIDKFNRRRIDYIVRTCDGI